MDGSGQRRRRLGRLVAALLIAVVLVVAWRIVFYRQRDDPEHLASKNAYLTTIAAASGAGPAGPSFVFILFDDLGYGDVGAYGGRAIATPHLDRLAGESARFTHAYSPSPYCTGSRAGFLTGRSAPRSGLDHVVAPRTSIFDKLQRLGGMNRRLPAEEITISEVLAAAGYATAAFGKWHVGDESPSLPNDRGFAEYYGLLHSNDMEEPVVWRNREVAEEHPIDQSTLTRRYTERAVAFIEAHRDEGFFLYLPHTFPHVPLHVATDRRGQSDAGLYGDVVEELDESVGRILATLERFALAEDTFVVVTSDNGPWFQGSSGGTRGRKHHVFEGGMRVPFLVRWPGRIPAGSVFDEPTSGLDLFPTFLELAGLPLPEDRLIDGRSLLPRLTGQPGAAPELIFFFQLGKLQAVRAGRYKYHAPHGVFYGNPMDWPWAPMSRKGPWLFDLLTDPDESYDISERRPEVARRLHGIWEAKQREMAESPRGWR